MNYIIVWVFEIILDENTIQLSLFVFFFPCFLIKEIEKEINHIINLYWFKSQMILHSFSTIQP